eukprot:gnl/TRDRNA2_/TRDRNA2_92870_c0_seq1.p1 gnl/TRDRNA2_/TRDRNA2_92870_c0~~gnl/TRDRNA2_/TRDRNA2_92870_c0_seq1.p1  ORF type:complete len:449 (+),score=82.67 gnl/TRDRNA2_/TRDRNA2_92870_c0_seq1:150-1349(+)
MADAIMLNTFEIFEQKVRSTICDQLPKASSLAPCHQRGFSRRLRPREAGPPVEETMFPADCLPWSAPVARSMPPEAEIALYFRGAERRYPVEAEQPHAPLGCMPVATELSAGAEEVLFCNAVEALEGLMQAAQQEAAVVIQHQWRKAKGLAAKPPQQQATMPTPQQKPLPAPPGTPRSSRGHGPRRSCNVTPILVTADAAPEASTTMMVPSTPSTPRRTVGSRPLGSLAAVVAAESRPPRPQGPQTPAGTRRPAPAAVPSAPPTPTNARAESQEGHRDQPGPLRSSSLSRRQQMLGVEHYNSGGTEVPSHAPKTQPQIPIAPQDAASSGFRRRPEGVSSPKKKQSSDEPNLTAMELDLMESTPKKSGRPNTPRLLPELPSNTSSTHAVANSVNMVRTIF